MRYCPLMSFAKQYSQEQACLGEDCAMAADGAGECLIRQALECYVSERRTAQAEEEAAIRYWAMKKDGTRTPITFTTPQEPTEVKLDPPRVDGSYIYF